MSESTNKMPQEKIVRIGGAGAFLGDSQIAVPQLLAAGGVDYIILDYLAEATMSVLARESKRHPERAYARDFTEWVWKQNLQSIRQSKVKIITNAGGLDPDACRARLRAIAAEAELDFRIAVVKGDDLRDRVGEFRERKEMFNGKDMPSSDQILSMNAYFGAGAIVEALKLGADIVITGRVVDSALVLGPLVHEFGWSWESYDLLSAGSLAGHVLECGAQATGGLFTDWEDVPDWAHIGYPIAECRSDGSFVVTKAEGTGGLCTPATVSEQILYEVGDPQRYALPDVTCDFTEVTTRKVGDNRVEVRGAKGAPPSGKYKVCLTYQDGWRVISIMPVVGRDAARKAKRQAEAVLERVAELLAQKNLSPFKNTQIEVLGAESTYGANASEGARQTREVVCKLAAEHDDPAALRILLREIESPMTSMSVGSTGWFGARPVSTPVARVFSFLNPADEIEAVADFEGWEQGVAAPKGRDPQATPALPAGEATVAKGNTRQVKLIDLAWARSGDKGNNFNIGVIARRPEYLPFIRGRLTGKALEKYFAHDFADAGAPSVNCYEVPGLNALNLVFGDALGGGQMGTLRLDALAKGKAQQILDMEISIPSDLL